MSPPPLAHAEHMAVAGYGHLDLAAQKHPAVTTGRVDRETMGRRAIAVLLRGERKQVVDVGFEIVERESA